MVSFCTRRGNGLRLQGFLAVLAVLVSTVSCGGNSSQATAPATVVPAAPAPAPAPPPPVPPAPVVPALSITTSSLPAGTSGSSYSATLSASGGVAPYSWTVAAGAFPAGLRLDPTSGAIGGTPTTTGTFVFTIQVSDAGAKAQSAALSITITPPPNNITQVVIVVEENKSFDDVIGNKTDMPYLNSLTPNAGVARNYFANVLSSQGDYFMLTIGQVLTDNSSFTDVVFADNIVRHLEAAGKRWKIYAESIPSVGYTGGDQYPYIKIHNPFAYIDDVLDGSADHMVPFVQFAGDLESGKLPNYSFVIPNDIDDGHTCGPGNNCDLGTELAATDRWLRNNIAPLLNNSNFKQHGLLLITWDESNGDNTHGGGRVATVIVGAKVIPGHRSDTFFQHQSLLKLSMQALGLEDFPGAAASAPDMLEFFTGPIP